MEKVSKHSCEIDLNRFVTISECIETHGMEYRAPEDEWVWNVISRQAVTYSCGAMCREGETLQHNHELSEIALCKRLSAEAANIMAAHYIHEGDEGSHKFSPFYVSANEGVFTPKILSEETVRLAFGGTIYPFAEVSVEPLHNWVREKEKEFEDYLEDNEYPEGDREWDYERNYVASWRELTEWFKQQPELHDASLVSIDIKRSARKNDPERNKRDRYNGGCVFPRLAVALTTGGSLVGVFSCVVHT